MKLACSFGKVCTNPLLRTVCSASGPEMDSEERKKTRDNTQGVDNDNDNDTLREVPHQSNEGLALQARVSGPWLLKKESLLLGKLAHWQGVQVQTVMDRV